MGLYDIIELGMPLNPVESLGHRREVPVDCTIGGYLVLAGVYIPIEITLINRLSCLLRFIVFIILSLILIPQEVST